MISQWWSLIPPTVFAVGGILKDRGKKWEPPGFTILSMSGLGWMVYGILRNEVTVWVVGALIASAYCLKLTELARGSATGKLDEEDKA
jgi:uncharacterized protein with PQ loop repeat